MFKPLLHKKAIKYYGKLNDKVARRISKAIDNIITALLKKDLKMVNRVLDFSLIDGGHND